MNPAATPKALRADARRNRERVLDAARDCFARDGTDAQMDDIAAAAGVGVGTVYRHFATKDALVAALADDYFAGEAAIARAHLEIDDPWEAFRGFVREGTELLAASKALAQVMADRPDVMQRAALAADAEFGFFDMIETLITRAKAAGELRQDFQLEDIPAIMCSIGSLQVGGGAYTNWRRILGMVLDGLRTPLPAELPPISERLPRRARD